MVHGILHLANKTLRRWHWPLYRSNWLTDKCCQDWVALGWLQSQHFVVGQCREICRGYVGSLLRPLL